jgi:hypothetical protein
MLRTSRFSGTMINTYKFLREDKDIAGSFSKLMKTYKEFIEEFRYLPKAKMDKKIKDRENKGEGNTDKTQKIKLVRNVLGKNTNLSKDDIIRNVHNTQRVYNKRLSGDNTPLDKVEHYVDTTINASKKQKDIIKTRDSKSNKKNPTEYDKLKREYELTKQEVKNRAETETKRIINAKKRLEKAYNNSLEEKIVFEDYTDVINSLDNLEKTAREYLKNSI